MSYEGAVRQLIVTGLGHESPSFFLTNDRPQVRTAREMMRLLGHLHRSRRALESAVTTPVRASVQTGEPPNLAREGDPVGLTAEAWGFARPNHGLTTVVTIHHLRYPVEISENSSK